MVIKKKTSFELFKENLKPGFMFVTNSYLVLVLTVDYNKQIYSCYETTCNPCVDYTLGLKKENYMSYPISGMRHQNYEIIVKKS